MVQMADDKPKTTGGAGGDTDEEYPADVQAMTAIAGAVRRRIASWGLVQVADDKPKTTGDAGGDTDEAYRADQAMTGSADDNFADMLLLQTLQSLWIPAGQSREEHYKKYRGAAAALKGLAPRDELEGMLAGQMFATHAAAMDCLARAMVNGQTFEGREQNLKHAEKLLAVYARQVETLDKHRGKGQQKITVEHVTVNAGGQAIVGNVAAGAGSEAAAGGAATGADRPSLTHDPAPLAPQLEVVSLAKAKLKTRAR
jgi:hypothetical protein